MISSMAVSWSFVRRKSRHEFASLICPSVISGLAFLAKAIVAAMSCFLVSILGELRVDYLLEGEAKVFHGTFVVLCDRFVTR